MTRWLHPWLVNVLRAPGHLYDWRLGWLLGRRFLRLTHVGRRSGRPYQTMLEVVGEDRSTGEVVVLAGLGHRAQWYRNLQAHEGREVAIGRARFTPVHRVLGEDEAAAVLAAYERRHRVAAADRAATRPPRSWLPPSTPRSPGRLALRRQRRGAPSSGPPIAPLVRRVLTGGRGDARAGRS